MSIQVKVAVSPELSLLIQQGNDLITMTTREELEELIHRLVRYKRLLLLPRREE
jgi:hypothetical protein